jgi:hypothetical protein
MRVDLRTELITAAPASAITDGAPDGNGHPYASGLVDDTVFSDGTLNSISKTLLRISMKPFPRDGGTCYGDSGGANLLGSSNVIAATTITGDSVCRSTNVDYRMDTESARAFLSHYVSLP